MTDYTMDHDLAEKTAAADRYLLNEIDSEERASFEAHFFDCAICADKVRQGAAFIDTTKQILREENRVLRSVPWFRRANFTWLMPAVVVPSLATLCLAVIVGYQNLVTLPDLRRPQLLSTAVIAPLSREQASVVTIDPKLPHFNLNFMVDSPRVYRLYLCRFENETGGTILTLESGPRDVSAFTLSFLLPAASFPDGNYKLIVQPALEKDTVLQRYTFAIRRELHNEATH